MMSPPKDNLCSARGHLRYKWPYLCIMCPRRPKALTPRTQAMWDNRETDWRAVWEKMRESK